MILTDHELMERVQDRDSGAFDELLKRHEPRIRNRIQRIVQDAASAEDLVQEVFLRLWTRAEQWKGGSVIGWLARMARNLALNHQRSVHRRRSQPLELPSDKGDEDDDDFRVPNWMIDTAMSTADEIVDTSERCQMLRSLVQELPEQQREVIRMVHEADMEIREVADELDIPSGTVKSRLHYARETLADQLDDLAGC